MKEKFKSFLLISLVGLSLFFTKNLWLEMPISKTQLFNKREKLSSSSYLLSDMIAPNRYLLNFNDKYHTVFHDDYRYDLWTKAKGVLFEVLGNKDVEIFKLAKEDIESYNSERSIVFYFPEKVNTYILAKAFNIKEPNLIVDEVPNIDSIYVYLGDMEPFFIFSNEEKSVGVRNKSIDPISLRQQLAKIEEDKNYNFYQTMRERMEVDNDIFIPYEMKNTIPAVFVENEIRNLNENQKKELAEKFFNKDIDYIREIVENNGSTIYIYNQRVLKLNVNGTLEYFHALEESIQKRNLYKSMTTAAEFISNRGKVPEGMYLSKIEKIEADNSLGYNFTFKYRVRGIPVILGNEEVSDFVHIQVFNDHVRSYKHYARKHMDKPMENLYPEGKILSSFKVMDMNYDIILDSYLNENKDSIEKEEDIKIEDVLASIKNVTLAYFDPCLKDVDEELIAIWLIEMEKSTYAFDIYDGSLIYKKTK